ncbi:hypothetical protein AAG570_000034 [Ranatra chinensis]|uniref:SPRY domain-containing protein 7 n=1 Tax=Ranatra chinensis TaxID=642074 RepID=A0ABD0YVX8_9HEMI
MSIASVFCCVRNCFDGTGFNVKHVSKQEVSPIVLDSTHIGHDVVILKKGTRICGAGGALCTAPLMQSKSYFEVKLQQAGVWGIGVATKKCNLNKSPGGCDSESWVYCSDGTMKQNDTVVHMNIETPAEGDIIGVTYDHIELKFYINGKVIDKHMNGIKGNVYPVIFVDDGAVLDLIVEDFQNSQPTGFERIMIEQSLL